MTHTHSFTNLWLALIAGGAVLAACGGDGNGPGETTGTAQVTTVTTGADLDPDGYTLVADGSASTSIGINSNASFTQLPAGSHSLQLNGSAANCTVTSPNPLTVTVAAGRTVQATFTIVCTATSGSIQVSAPTTGVNAPPTYGVTIDGTVVGAVPSNGDFTFGPYPVGDHSVTLTVAANCTVTPPNPRTVTIPAATTTPMVTVTFAVSCAATEGLIEVTATTTGVDIPGIFGVTIDGAEAGTVSSNGSFTFGPYPVGNHSVTLTVAANCTVTPPNPRTVTIPAAATTPTVTAAFVVSCVATAGFIEVSASSSGVNVPAIYGVTIDGAEAGTVSPNGSFTFGPYPVGNRSVTLTVAANCTVTPPNPRTVTIPVAATTPTVTAAFVVSCVATAGFIEVSASSSGVNVPAIYGVTIDGAEAGTVSPNGSFTFGPYPVGNRSVTLTVAANCTVTPPNPRTVTIPAAATTPTVTAAFVVSCVATEGFIEVSATSTGVNVPATYGVTIDGASVGAVSPNANFTFGPYSVGDHSVTLTVGANCTVTPPNPRTVTIPTGSTTPTVQTGFIVSCVATEGFIEVSASSSGVNVPPTYDVTIDGTASGAVVSNGNFTFGPYSVGDHSVTLGVLANCTVTPPNPRTVTIPAASTTPTVPATFAVSCAATEGFIEVNTASSGVNVPPSYDVTIDGTAAGAVVSNGNFTFVPYPVGDHSVTLTVGANCTVTPPNPRTVTIPTGSTTPTVQASFTAECT